VIIKALTSSLLIKVAGGGVGFFSNLIIAKAYGVEESGIYFSFISMVWLVSTILMFGSEQSSVRQIAAVATEGTDSCTALFRSNFSLVIAFSGCVLLFFVCVDLFFSLDSYIPWDVEAWYIGLSVFMSCVYKLLCEFLKGAGYYLWYGFFQGVYYSLIVLIVSSLVFFGFSKDIGFLISTIPFTLLVGWLVITWLLCFKFDVGFFDILGFKVDLDRIKEAMTLWGASVSDALIAFSGSVILMYLVGPSEASIYHISSRIIALITMVLTATNVIAVVKINGMIKKNDISGCMAFARKLSTLSLLVIFPVVMGLIVFGKEILSFFGEGFEAGIYCLYILLVSAVINVGASSCSLILIGLEKGRQHTQVTFISLLFFVGLGVHLAEYGAIGMAVAVAVAVITKSVTTVLYVHFYTGKFLLPTMNVKDVLKINL